MPAFLLLKALLVTHHTRAQRCCGIAIAAGSKRLRWRQIHAKLWVTFTVIRAEVPAVCTAPTLCCMCHTACATPVEGVVLIVEMKVRQVRILHMP
jgi:hypothetical protein